MLLKGPLKKGDVREALDKRILKARAARHKLETAPTAPGVDLTRPVEIAGQMGREKALQDVRKQLFGERLPEAPRSRA